MANAKISQACANFLTDIDLGPGKAQGGGGINDAGTQKVNFVDDYRNGTDYDVKVRMQSLVRGSLTHKRHSSRAVLDLEYSWCRYRESITGASTLTIFDHTLPETLCIGLPRGRYRLMDLIDFSDYKPWFFMRANPIVRSIRNVVRMRPVDYRRRRLCAGLLVTMTDDWSHDNWDYWSPDEGYVDEMG